MKIMLVEDNPGDVMLTQVAFSEAKFETQMRVLRDGEEAQEYFSAITLGHHDWVPDLVLLDLNLPKVDGPQVLQTIKSRSVTKGIPVIVLTSSDAESDVVKTYDLSADGYVVKPLTIEQFTEVANTIQGFVCR